MKSTNIGRYLTYTDETTVHSGNGILPIGIQAIESAEGIKNAKGNYKLFY